ncbi:hypothetical protein M422DRAFT_247164 [Sphaerobolus stellatus SS14]|nr:hypothetical protein M422DRAFT_247164 [Sphaerobolus stellatus SS14]
MGTHCSRKRAEELSTPAVGEDEPLQGLIAGELTDPPQTSVDPQQGSEVFAQEHPGDQNVRAHGPQTVPVWVQSPIGVAGAASTSAPSLHSLQVRFRAQPREVGRLHEEYAELMNLKENSEIVLVEAMEATERLNTVFNQIRESMNRMSPTMKELLIVPKQKSSGKTIEPGNNCACDKAAAKAATERIVVQGAVDIPVTGT